MKVIFVEKIKTSVYLIFDENKLIHSGNLSQMIFYRFLITLLSFGVSRLICLFKNIFHTGNTDKHCLDRFFILFTVVNYYLISFYGGLSNNP